jgi:virginiamycin B lyase
MATCGSPSGLGTRSGASPSSPLPTHSLSSLPEGITVGPDGNLWFAEFNVGNIGRITTAGLVTEFHIFNGGPWGIRAGPDGNLWFTEADANSIGRITTGGSFTSLFPLPSTCGNKFGCKPLGITAGPDGNLWFTEFQGNKIGRITTQ